MSSDTKGSSGGHGIAPRTAEKALSDKLIDMIVANALPATFTDSRYNERVAARQGRGAPFSVGLMNRNFSDMVTRIGPVFDVYFGLLDCMAWKKPSQTVSWLCIYTYVCLHPQLLAALPLLYVLAVIMVPAYAARHPPPTVSPATDRWRLADGDPLRPAPVPKPLHEFSREAFLNVVDIQNTMPEYSRGYDEAVAALSKFAYFVDEPTSCAAFVALGGAALATAAWGPTAARFVPWRLLFIVFGWLVVCIGHPSAAKQLSSPTPLRPPISDARLHAYAAREFGDPGSPDSHHAEVFEIQSFDTESHSWLPSIFTPDPSLDYRHLPVLPVLTGSPSTADVLPPADWAFAPNSSWALDYVPEKWLSARAALAAFTVNNLEKWVYDRPDDSGSHLLRRRRWLRPCIRTTH